MDWTDWRPVEDGGTIPEELLPATRFQYLWRIHHDFAIALETGTIRMEFRTKFGSHQLLDKAAFTFYAPHDPLGGGVSFYTYWLGSGTTEVEAGEAKRPSGATTGQLVFSPGSYGGMGGMWGYFYGDLYGDIWVGDIGADERVEFVNWYPCSGIPHGKQLWLRTLKGEAPMQTVLDPVTHNTHEFWTYRGQLITRRRLNTDGLADGLRSGGGVLISDGRVVCYPGLVVIGQRQYTSQMVSLSVPTAASYLVMIVVQNGVATPVLHSTGPYPQPHCCIARVDGSVVSQDLQQLGTVITGDCDLFSAWIEDDGALRVDVNGVGERVRYESRDRGASWAALG